MGVTSWTLLFLGLFSVIPAYRVISNRSVERAEAAHLNVRIAAGCSVLIICLIPWGLWEKFYGWHERVPLSFAAAGLVGNEWDFEDFVLAGRITVKQFEILNAKLDDAVRRKDGAALMAIASPATDTVLQWNNQKDNTLKDSFHSCLLAQSQFVDFVLNANYRDHTDVDAYKANFNECKSSVGW